MDKSWQSYSNSKFWWRVHDQSADIRLQIGGFDSQIQILEGFKNFKVNQVDMFRKGKIKRNTMKIIFRLIQCKWKKLLKENASNVLILMVFRKFRRPKIERLLKF